MSQRPRPRRGPGISAPQATEGESGQLQKKQRKYTVEQEQNKEMIQKAISKRQNVITV